MRCACIDIGSNTTRLLIAEADPDPARAGVRVVVQERAFTRINRAMDADGRIAAAKLAEIAAVVERQAALAREAGVGSLRVVATSAIRRAANRDDVVAAVRAQTGLDAHVLTEQEEGRLAFLGATRCAAATPAEGVVVGVVDIGGGSTEITVGSAGRPIAWCRSYPVGSGLLADAHIRSDPPADGEVAALESAIARAFADGPRPPEPAVALAVGGSATSLRRLCGPVLDPRALDAGLAAVLREPAAAAADRLELDVERVRLLPAAILLLRAATRVLGAGSLAIAGGGLREGVVLELLAATDA